MAGEKLQIALYWGAACGGCDVAVLDTNEFILDVHAAADIRLWPIAVDGKYADVEAMEDGELDLALYNGAVRNLNILVESFPSNFIAQLFSFRLRDYFEIDDRDRAVPQVAFKG